MVRSGPSQIADEGGGSVQKTLIQQQTSFGVVHKLRNALRRGEVGVKAMKLMENNNNSGGGLKVKNRVT